MKKKFTHFIFLLCMSMTFGSFAQDRFLNEVFTDVTVTNNVTYGENFTVLTLPVTGATGRQSLLMDVYEPTADTETSRPVVLVFHTGNFLPPVSNAQIAGSKADSSVVEICTQLARRGFVAAAVDYRLGWNPLAMTQPERALGLIQAAYRGTQDGNTAIRYFKKSVAEDGNPYGIDDSKIAVWGNGTGGYLTLGLNGLSFYEEIPLASNPATKFLLDAIDATTGMPGQDGVPETPMVVPQYHGDIEGKVFTTAPDAAFGIPMGDTTNLENHVAYTSDHQLTINVGGALGDISWLDDQDTPIISVQSIDDMFAPYNDAILVVPTTGDPIVQVQGLQQIGAAQEANGMNQPWKDAPIADAVTAEAMANAATAGHPYYEGSYSWKSPNNSSGFDEGIVMNWWDPNGIIPPPYPCAGLAWNQCPHPTDPTQATSFSAQGLILNEGMSAAKARANIAKVMDYVMPRACVTLGLGCTIIDVEEQFLDAAAIEILPNPTTGHVTVNATGAEVIDFIEVYSVDGRLVSSNNNINNSQYQLNLNGNNTGMYVVKVYTENGVVAKKVMLKK